MRGIAAAVLVFEGMIVFFAMLVALDLSEVDDATLWWFGAGGAVLFFVGAGLLRRPWGLLAGSALQVVLIAAGVVVPAMFVIGVLFAALWFFTLHLGRKVERLRESGPA